MIKNTILIWIPSMVIIAVISFFAFKKDGAGLGFYIITLLASIVIFSIFGAVSGFLAATQKAHMTTAIIVSLVVGLLPFWISSNRFTYLDNRENFLSLIPFLAVVGGYALAKLISFLKVLFGH